MSVTECATVALEIRSATTEGDRHYLDVLCVPYGAVTHEVAYPGGEVFVRGAFADLIASPQAWPKVRLTDSHRDTTDRRPVAKGVAFTDEAEGLFGRFAMFDTPEGRGAWENVREDTYGGVSIGFIPGKETTNGRGVREVHTARLHHVSLVDEPAYRDARILATRAANAYDAQRTARDDELAEFFRAGYAPRFAPRVRRPSGIS